MNHSILAVAMAALLTFAPCAALAQDHAPSAAQSTEAAAPGDPAARTTAKPADAAATQTDPAADKAPTTQADDATGSQAQQDDALADAGDANEATMAEMQKQGQSGEGSGFHQVLKTKFIEGNAGFMSLVSLALILGLAFCIERIIFLSLSEINAKKFMADIASRIAQGDIEGARRLSLDTRGPVASLCAQGLARIDNTIDDIERGVTSYGEVQAANLEKGCSWITLFIAMAPSLGFLGTVIGMVMAFDQIQQAGDISPTIVASGMKVALITTIFGIIVALVLQVFYNFILSKIEHLTAQMEESVITLLDAIMEYKQKGA